LLRAVAPPHTRFDHSGAGGKQKSKCREAKRLSCFELDNQLKLCRRNLIVSLDHFVGAGGQHRR
jgi:hypothetical protein